MHRIRFLCWECLPSHTPSLCSKGEQSWAYTSQRTKRPILSPSCLSGQINKTPPPTIACSWAVVSWQQAGQILHLRGCTTLLPVGPQGMLVSSMEAGLGARWLGGHPCTLQVTWVLVAAACWACRLGVCTCGRARFDGSIRTAQRRCTWMDQKAPRAGVNCCGVNYRECCL